MRGVYYWPDVPNFGDELAIHLLNWFAGVAAVWSPLAQADVVVTGSVLEHITPGWAGHIIGAGRLWAGSDVRQKIASARVWALRGPLSAKGIAGDYALGDPGLLADELVADSVSGRVYDLGVLPHWSDRALSQRPEWYNRKWTTRVIMPGSGALHVVREISRCKKLVTSSLHGMIVADACGIPRRVEYSHTLDKEGGRFKFEDYSASVGCPLVFGETTEALRFRVEDRKHEIWDSFQALGSELRK
jgi:pyruvyltransferase